MEPQNTSLAVIVKESGLEGSKSQYILDNFQDYFKMAAEWEKKARTLEVTSSDQKAEMKMAREGRLFLKDKRLQIEKARKELKEQSLREGKAIDGISNVLKALIEPIEEYLDKQERFEEIREEERLQLERQEQAKKAAEAKAAADKLEAEERDRLQKENDRLKAEAKKADERLNREKDRKKDLQDELDRIEREKAEEAKKFAKEQADEKKRQAAQEKDVRYQEFLKEHGYSKETAHLFAVKVDNFTGNVELFKKVADFKN